ncbi:MAG: acetyl-CoA hydrolase/transferase family protein [Clostridiales bacterium]|nr:acetyl-CoA hydrolase/transferase family protein [Clostridiales bacterium]
MGHQERIRCRALQDKVITAAAAAAMIQDGMLVGTSGFTPSGYPKAIPLALAKRVKESGEQVKIAVMTGASVGVELDDVLTEAGIMVRRSPYQTSKTLRKSLNTAGGVEFFDEHLSRHTQNVRYGFYGEMDFAIVEACAITEDGHIVPTTSVGASPSFVQAAKKVLVELNIAQPLALEGMHDIYIPAKPPACLPIPLKRVTDRIGTPYIPCGPEKIVGIVISDIPDEVRPLNEPDDTAEAIAGHITEFLGREVRAGRLPKDLLPIQSGVGSVANAVLFNLAHSEFENLEFFSEVIQDAAFDLLDSGKFVVASGTALTPSPKCLKRFYDNIEFYRQRIILRPQEVSNNPEIARRLGVIAMNTAIEADIYGNVNSTHIMGTRLMNGIGGSGDFARSAYLSIFMTASTAKGGNISSIVPMCSHVDHTEHDVYVIATEQGLADLRNTSPRERALKIIHNCAHPDYRPLLLDYYQRALAATKNGACHTPHLLSEALSWHERFNQTGAMLP